MYVPFHNREPEREKIIAFMREYPFATFITTRDRKITATHLPTLIDERADDLFIIAHLARANTQWADFSSDALPSPDALVIFQEPHAFISTRHYENALSVPTWNYVAIHAYGIPRVLESVDARLDVVKRFTAHFEGNLDQFNALPDDFKRKKVSGIVAFELCVTQLDARFKLSQDRSRIEQENIVAALTQRADIEATLGEIMQAKLQVTP